MIVQSHDGRCGECSFAYFDDLMRRFGLDPLPDDGMDRYAATYQVDLGRDADCSNHDVVMVA